MKKVCRNGWKSITTATIMLSMGVIATPVKADFATGVIIGMALNGDSEPSPKEEKDETITHTTIFLNDGTEERVTTFASNEWIRSEETNQILICSGKDIAYRTFDITGNTRCVSNGTLIVDHPQIPLSDHLKIKTGRAPLISKLTIMGSQEKTKLEVTYTLGEAIDAASVARKHQAGFADKQREITAKKATEDSGILNWNVVLWCAALTVVLSYVFRPRRTKNKTRNQQGRSSYYSPSKTSPLVSPRKGRGRTSSSDDNLITGIMVGSTLSSSGRNNDCGDTGGTGGGDGGGCGE